MATEPTLVQMIRQFRAGLIELEAGTLESLEETWSGVRDNLAGQFAAMSLDIEAMRDAGEEVGQWRLYELDRYRGLVAQAETQVQTYSEAAERAIASAQHTAGIETVQHAEDVFESMGVGEATGGFRNLPVQAVEEMVGKGADGTPLNNLLMDHFPDRWQNVETALIDGIAQGKNVRDVAEAMADFMDDTLVDVFTIAQTEIMRAYRETSRNTYIESDVVEGMIRLASKDSRTCVACLAADGRLYALDEPFADHPGGHCTLIPKVEGIAPPKWTKGEEYFKRLPEDEQRRRMGPGRYAAWKEGLFEFGDLAKHTTSDEWGPGLGIAPLKELVSEEDEKNRHDRRRGP